MTAPANHPDVHPAAHWLSVREFAAVLQVSRHTIYRACERGEIAWIPAFGEKRIPPSELERLTAEAQERRSA